LCPEEAGRKPHGSGNGVGEGDAAEAAGERKARRKRNRRKQQGRGKREESGIGGSRIREGSVTKAVWEKEAVSAEEKDDSIQM